MDNLDIISLLLQQKENFPIINDFLESKKLEPSVIFIPQTIKQLDSEFYRNQELVQNCISYLDTVKVYSTIVYNDPEFFTEHIKTIIINNRSVVHFENCISKDVISDFIFNDKNEAYNFLENNKILLSIYIYSLVSLISYSS